MTAAAQSGRPIIVGKIDVIRAELTNPNTTITVKRRIWPRSFNWRPKVNAAWPAYCSITAITKANPLANTCGNSAAKNARYNNT